MTNSLRLCFGLSLSAMLLSGCGTDSASPDAADVDGQVTFLVKGMMDRLSIY